MTKEEQLKRELQELFRRYGVRLERHTDYDGDDNPSGDSFTLVGKGIALDITELIP